jgi:hypothetical protein
MTPLSWHYLWCKRHRRALREKFARAHEASLREWATWWDHEAPTEQSGPWAGVAQDLARHPVLPDGQDASF